MEKKRGSAKYRVSSALKKVTDKQVKYQQVSAKYRVSSALKKKSLKKRHKNSEYTRLVSTPHNAHLSLISLFTDTLHPAHSKDGRVTHAAPAVSKRNGDSPGPVTLGVWSSTVSGGWAV